MTQESVAWHAGVAVATLQKIEHGQAVRAGTACAGSATRWA
jgi:hypothetical protein